MYRRIRKIRGAIIFTTAILAAELLGGCLVKASREIPLGNEETVRVVALEDSSCSGIEVSRDVILACIQRCKNEISSSWQETEPPTLSYDEKDPAIEQALNLIVQHIRNHGKAMLFRWKGGWSSKVWSRIDFAHRTSNGNAIECKYEAAWESLGKLSSRVSNKRTPFTLRIDEVAGRESRDSGAKDCRLNSDCPVGNYCQEGRCTFDCREDRDCEGGLTCNNQNGRCE